jgi:hypothetical protein
MDSVSCASAGDCSAVGNYFDSSGNQEGLLLSEVAGKWAKGVEATPPATAGSNPFLGLDSVSCASAGNCSAVGTFLDSSGNQQGLLSTESSGKWAKAVEASPPADTRANPLVFVGSVSCAKPGDCSAVGNYVDSSGNWQGVLLSESSGKWAKGVEAVLPANAGSNPDISLGSVSCASPGDCSAVGTYDDKSGNVQGLLLSESSGKWAKAVEATLPATAGSSTGVGLGSVSCASPGHCSAVGTYFDSSANQQGLLLTESSGKWETGVQAVLPSNVAANPGVELGSVSCARSSPGNCSAFGTYDDPSGNIEGLLLSESSGKWASGVEAVLPANAGSNPNIAVGSVSCASPGDCSAVARYEDTSHNSQGLLLGSETPVAPTVTSLAPNAGSTSGGNKIAVNGTGFTPGATVKFGTTASQSVTFVSSTRLTVVVPAHLAGVVNVTVTSSGSASTPSSRDLYAYGRPTVGSFAPTAGITGSTVTITGTHFVPGTKAKFAGLASPSVTFVSTTEIKAVVPDGAVKGKIAATTPAGTGSSATNFTPTLSITSFSPASDPVKTVVTINGVGFTTSSTVKFNGIAASRVTYVSAKQLKATVPPTATSGPITVTNTAAPRGTVSTRARYTVT